MARTRMWRAGSSGRSAPGDAGFTLFELLIVMTVMAMAFVAISALSKGPSAGVQVKSAARQMASRLRDLRAAAMTTGSERVATIDVNGRAVRFSDGRTPLELSHTMAISVTGAESERARVPQAACASSPTAAPAERPSSSSRKGRLMRFGSTGLRAGSRPPRSIDGMAPGAESGFTLLETLTALTILGIALVSLFDAHQRGLRAARVADDHVEARILAQSLLADATTGNSGVVVPRRGNEGRFGWAIEVQPAGGGWADLKSEVQLAPQPRARDGCLGCRPSRAARHSEARPRAMTKASSHD